MERKVCDFSFTLIFFYRNIFPTWDLTTRWSITKLVCLNELNFSAWSMKYDNSMNFVSAIAYFNKMDLWNVMRNIQKHWTNITFIIFYIFECFRMFSIFWNILVIFYSFWILSDISLKFYNIFIININILNKDDCFWMILMIFLMFYVFLHCFWLFLYDITCFGIFWNVFKVF